MKFDVLDMNGKKVSDIELSDAVFGLTPNEKVMHAAVVNFLANQRQGTQSTKPAVRFPAAAANPGVKRAPVVLVRVPPAARSGHTAVSHLAPSPAITAIA